MMQGELPFAGHPSLGTAVAVARARGERAARYVQQTAPGCSRSRSSSAAAPPARRCCRSPRSSAPRSTRRAVLGALGLDGADAHPELPPQIVSTGLTQLMVPVREAAALDRVAPDPAALRVAARGPGVHVRVPVVHRRGPRRPRRRAASSSTAAVVEDPATGSAAGPLWPTRNARTGVARARRSTRASRWGARAASLCEAGERVRVAGDGSSCSRRRSRSDRDASRPSWTRLKFAPGRAENRGCNPGSNGALCWGTGGAQAREQGASPGAGGRAHFLRPGGRAA